MKYVVFYAIMTLAVWVSILVMVEHTVPQNLQYYNTTSYAHMELMFYHNYLFVYTFS